MGEAIACELRFTMTVAKSPEFSLELPMWFLLILLRYGSLTDYGFH